MPCAMVLGFSYNALCQSTITKTVAFIIGIGASALFTIAIVTFLCVRQRYFLCYWLMLQRKDLSARDIIAESTRLMDKKCVDLFLFKLRFTAWILLTIFVFPAVIYVYPYYKHACAVYAFEIFSFRNKCEDKTLTFERLR